MDKMETRLDIFNKAKKRMKELSFGDPVTNVCAGDKNPQRHSYFAKLNIQSHTNKFGITHKQYLANCTDRKGKFWNTDIEVIFPGHLEYEESMKIYEPIHAAHFDR